MTSPNSFRKDSPYEFCCFDMKNGVSLDLRSMVDRSMDKAVASCVLSPTFSLVRNILQVIHEYKPLITFKQANYGYKKE